jgi:hypothetical protein
MKTILGSIIITLLLTGCNSMRPENFKDSEPKLVLFDYFKGKTSAWGIFEDRFGNVRRQFQVDIEGQVKGTNEFGRYVKQVIILLKVRQMMSSASQKVRCREMH